MCLGNISKDFTINNMKNKTKQKNKKKTGLKGQVQFFLLNLILLILKTF